MAMSTLESGPKLNWTRDNQMYERWLVLPLLPVVMGDRSLLVVLFLIMSLSGPPWNQGHWP